MPIVVPTPIAPPLDGAELARLAAAVDVLDRLAGSVAP
jgi:hypothetical protein